jgi:uncharacterized membrane protein
MQRRGVLATLLLVSLAANVFVVAYWAASSTRDRMGVMRPVPIAMAYRIADRLSEPAASSLKSRLDALQPQFDRELSLYDEALARGAVELARETVEQAALTAAIEEARQHRGRIGDLLTEAFVTTVSELPPQTRRRLVEQFTDLK